MLEFQGTYHGIQNRRVWLTSNENKIYFMESTPNGDYISMSTIMLKNNKIVSGNVEIKEESVESALSFALKGEEWKIWGNNADGTKISLKVPNDKPIGFFKISSQVPCDRSIGFFNLSILIYIATKVCLRRSLLEEEIEYPFYIISNFPFGKIDSVLYKVRVNTESVVIKYISFREEYTITIGYNSKRLINKVLLEGPFEKAAYHLK
jgi:hypothetical protein